MFMNIARQIQKMVHDIKKNDGGIMNKIKKCDVTDFQLHHTKASAYMQSSNNLAYKELYEALNALSVRDQFGNDAVSTVQTVQNCIALPITVENLVIKNKPPPSPPIRDYASGSHDDHEEDQWSDDFDSSDYENPDEHSNSETYVDPNEEHFEEYEPPPTEQEARKIAPAFRISKGEYADS
ncbi:B-cell linker protein-like [Latimeria chalumnae]|uniref:B-cell linker protein-like n=1 Tax=Latimeria chalumnae TaxID=7897 RepID=UPI00313BAE72